MTNYFSQEKASKQEGSTKSQDMEDDVSHHDVIIIGAGLTGLCIGAKQGFQ